MRKSTIDHLKKSNEALDEIIGALNGRITPELAKTDLGKRLTSFFNEHAFTAEKVSRMMADDELAMKVISEVKHSESKPAWNVVSTRAGSKYKLARFPYLIVGDNPQDEYNSRQSQNARLLADRFANMMNTESITIVRPAVTNAVIQSQHADTMVELLGDASAKHLMPRKDVKAFLYGLDTDKVGMARILDRFTQLTRYRMVEGNQDSFMDKMELQTELFDKIIKPELFREMECVVTTVVVLPENIKKLN